MDGEFVGRVQELGLMRARLEAVAAQRAGFLLIEGDGGSGKTTLAGAFAARSGDATVVRVTGDEDETAVPYGLLDQLRAGLPAGSGDPGAQPPRDPVAEGIALLKMLAEAQTAAPLILLIDDAHLGDRLSLRSITFALRRLRAERVLTVVTTRPDGVPRLPPGLVRLVNEAGARIALAGMSTAEVRDLASAHGFGRLSERGAERLRAHTEGNPLYLRALLADLTPEQVESPATSLPAPGSLAQQVVGALAEMRPATRRLAAAAAVLGSQPRLPDVARLAGVPDPLPAVEELQQGAMADLVDDRLGTRLAFAHPLIRSAIYGSLGASTRARLHTAASAMCSGRAALRHRLAAATGPDRELVDALVAQAGEDRRRGSWWSAADMMLSAVRLCERGPQRNRLLIGGVELLLLDGDLTTAQTYAADLEELPVDAHRLQVQARMAWLSGDHARADAYGQAAWTSAGSLDPHTRDNVAAMLSMMHILRSDGAGAARWADRALESRLLSPGTTATTQAAGAIGLALIGRADEGLAMLAHVASDRVAGGYSPGLAARGMLRLWTDDLSGARSDLRASLPAAGRGPGIGMDPYRLTALGYLIDTQYRRGDWADAVALAEQAVALVEDSGQAWLAAFVHALAVLVPAARGQWATAEEHLRAARAAAATLSDGPSRAYAANAAVHLAYCRDDADQVEAAAQWLLTGERGPNHEPGFLGWSVQHAGALIKAGRLPAAAARIADLERIARARGRRSRLAALARLRGELAMAERDNTSARAAFEEAVRLRDGAGDALEAAVGEQAYGRFLRRRGERRAAVERLSRASRMFADLRAEPFRQRCRKELTACGVTSEAPAGHPLLTPQEAAVAELVCTGRTNQQVADDLMVSVKTVGYHLAHVYAKVGVTSRTQLMVRLGTP